MHKLVHVRQTHTHTLLMMTYSEQVDLLAVLQEVPHLGSHLYPHPTQVPQNAHLLKGTVHLRGGWGGKREGEREQERDRGRNEFNFLFREKNFRVLSSSDH